MQISPRCAGDFDVWIRQARKDKAYKQSEDLALSIWLSAWIAAQNYFEGRS